MYIHIVFTIVSCSSNGTKPNERQTFVKKPTTKKRSRTNWARIDALKNKDLDFSDIPEQGNAFFKRAILRLPEPKTAVTIRLDRQGLNWFKAKAQGPGYQTRINALLRAYMEALKDREGAARCPSCSQNAHGETLLVRCAQ